MKTKTLSLTSVPNRVKFRFEAVPKHEMDALCRDLIHSIKDAAKKPKFMARYEAWLVKKYGKREGSKRFKLEKEALCAE